MRDGGFRVALIDIETCPNLAWVWGKYEQNVIAFEKEWHILSFAVRWQGSPRTEVYALPDFPLYKRQPDNDLAICKKLREVLDQADLVVAHNGDRFDVRKINARLLEHGLTPPSPYRTFDTLKELRRIAMLNSNRLGDVAKNLFGMEKVDTGGFKLWRRCLRKDMAAWAKMKRYNAQDVVLLEKLYLRLRAWSTTHPNITMPCGQDYRCPVCGSKNVRRAPSRWRYLKSWRAELWKCYAKKCGKYSTGRRERIPNTLLSA